MIPVPWAATCLHRSHASVEDILDRSLGIYATQPTGHLELLARLGDYCTADLRRVVEVERTAVRVSTLRGSAFLIPVSLLPVTQAATRDRRVRTLSYVHKALQTADYEAWASRIEEILADGPLPSDEIRVRLNPPASDASNIRYVIRLMATENRLVAATTSGTWRSGRTAVARWGDWLPDVDVWSLDPDQARVQLAAIYLDRHGPATVEDFAWWAGLTKTQAKNGFERVGTQIAGTNYFETGPVDSGPPPGVRLLPIWDTLFVTYKDRTRFIADDHYPLVYDRDGNATSVVLIDGMAAGQWTLGGDDQNLEVRIAPFDAFTRAHRSAIETEATRIGAMIGTESVAVVEWDAPVDLTAAKRNRFMSPLRETQID